MGKLTKEERLAKRMRAMQLADMADKGETLSEEVVKEMSEEKDTFTNNPFELMSAGKRAINHFIRLHYRKYGAKWISENTDMPLEYVNRRVGALKLDTVRVFAGTYKGERVEGTTYELAHQLGLTLHQVEYRIYKRELNWINPKFMEYSKDFEYIRMNYKQKSSDEIRQFIGCDVDTYAKITDELHLRNHRFFAFKLKDGSFHIKSRHQMRVFLDYPVNAVSKRCSEWKENNILPIRHHFTLVSDIKEKYLEMYEAEFGEDAYLNSNVQLRKNTFVR